MDLAKAELKDEVGKAGKGAGRQREPDDDLALPPGGQLLAGPQPDVLLLARGQEAGEVGVDDSQPGLAVDRVVDRQRPPRPHLAGVVDALRDLQPGSAHREHQDVRRDARHGQRVARVEDRGAVDREQVAAVVEVRQLGMDHRMLLPHHLDR